MAGGRKKKLLVFALLIALIVALVPQVPVFAEETKTMTMKQLYYSIWPEYDRWPDVLVIYTGVFVNDTGKPFDGELRYKVPKNAEINMVCETEQGMVCQKYIVEKDNPDYDVVVWKPSHPIEPGAEFPVMMEYYYRPFGSANPRQFTQTFRPAFPVENLTVEIKAPKGATEVSLQPEPAKTQGDDEGFTNYIYRYNGLTVEDELTFDISYVRESNEPSVKAETGQGNVAGGMQPVQAQSSVNSTIVILLVVFIALLAVFLFIAISNNNQKATQKSKSKKGGKKTKSLKGKQGGVSRKEVAEEKRKLRKMLLDGKISEDTYKKLLEEIDE
ncbi:MAG: hypothetical protein H0Z35_05370 [Thermoanaerobacteraceae bacterium]|nr:hypothetical protein [Thermoanaerobacteraceae bacterium]